MISLDILSFFLIHFIILGYYICYSTLILPFIRKPIFLVDEFTITYKCLNRRAPRPSSFRFASPFSTFLPYARLQICHQIDVTVGNLELAADMFPVAVNCSC
jgi:hypothetical protein